MKMVVGVLLVGASLALPAFAGGDGIFARVPGGADSVFHGPAAGDEDPFPLMCADFSGQWKSDAGERYSISQRQCAFLRVQMYDGYDQAIQTIIPDNKVRPDHGSQVRHRWNAPNNATVLESHRTFFADQATRVTEVTMFERASGDLLLETTYRTIQLVNAPGQPPRHEYEQVVFRRFGATPPSRGGENDSCIPPPKRRPSRR